MIKTVLVLFIFSSRTVLSRNSSDEIEESLFDPLITLAEFYTKNCLWVMISETTEINVIYEEINRPHVILEYDATRYDNFSYGCFKETLRTSCISYLFQEIPSDNILKLILEPCELKLDHFFITKAFSKADAIEFLQKPILSSKENVVAAVESGRFFDCYIRNIFTLEGKFVVKRGMTFDDRKYLVPLEEIFPDQTKNLNGILLYGSTLLFRPFTDYEVSEGSRLVGAKQSLDFNMLDMIAEKMNFRYEVYTPEDKLWGTMLDNGSWTGIVGDIEKKTANFSLVLSMILERTAALDFTMEYFIDTISFVSSKHAGANTWTKVISPLTNEVWVTLTISLAASFFVYFLLLYVKIGKNKMVRSLADSSFDMFGSFFSQSLVAMPVNDSGRIFLCFWLLYGLIVTTYYKTAFMATLTVPVMAPTLDTLQQLEDSNVKYGMALSKGAPYVLFQNSKIPLHMQMFQKMSFHTETESMIIASKKEYAFIYYKSNLETIVASEYTDEAGIPELHVARTELFPGGYAWGFPKGSPLLKPFDAMMQRMTEAGYLKKWLKELRRIYYLEEHEKQKELGIEKKSKFEQESAMKVLNMKHLSGAFLLLALGILLSTVVFLGELLHFRMNRKKYVNSFDTIQKSATENGRNEKS